MLAAYAKEGADLTILYLNEHIDAKETQRYMESLGAKCQLIAGDLHVPATSQNAVSKTIRKGFITF